jgi:uncharacterized membrane protein YebE (DUF533 family)
MAKRSGLLRVAARPHAPGAAGGSKSSSAKKIKKNKLKKERKKLKKTTAAAAVASISAASASALASMDDDMFAMAVPTPVPQQQQQQQQRPIEVVETVSAFQDQSKDELFRSILSAAAGSKPTGKIPADEHRARMEELKRQRSERQALKAERFAAHKKC